MVVVVGYTTADPEVAEPQKLQEGIHELVYCEFQVSVELPPLWILEGLAVRFTDRVGRALTVRVNVVVWVTPPVPVTVIV